MGTIGIPVFVLADPLGGWKWVPHNSIYDQMIVSIYFALGIFCFRALRDPLASREFLWFVVWSSVAHGGVMLFHAVHAPVHRGHLLGDVFILAGAVGLAIPLRKAERERSARCG
jgi:hypothetical protein